MARKEKPQALVTITIEEIMRSMSHVVQCKWPEKPFYETIAAFDNERIARDYMNDCAKGAKVSRIPFSYRLGKIEKE